MDLRFQLPRCTPIRQIWSSVAMDPSCWLLPVARSRFISRAIDEEVGILPDNATFSSSATFPRDNGLKTWSVLFLFLNILPVGSAMAFKVGVIFLLVIHLVRCTSPNDLGSDLTILINSDLLGTLALPGRWFPLTLCD